MAPPPKSTTAAVAQFDVVRQEQSSVVSLGGEIDCATAPLLEAHLRDVMATGTTRVSIDLRDVAFLGIAGLHLFDRLGEELASAGGRIEIVCTAMHRRLFAIIDLDESLNVRSDLDPARHPIGS